MMIWWSWKCDVKSINRKAHSVYRCVSYLLVSYRSD